MIIIIQNENKIIFLLKINNPFVIFLLLLFGKQTTYWIIQHRQYNFLLFVDRGDKDGWREDKRNDKTRQYNRETPSEAKVLSYDFNFQFFSFICHELIQLGIFVL